MAKDSITNAAKDTSFGFAYTDECNSKTGTSMQQAARRTANKSANNSQSQPKHHHHHNMRQSLPAPPDAASRTNPDLAVGSSGKQQRTTTEKQALERHTTGQQPKGKMRINTITFTARDGKHKTASNEDPQEMKTRGSATGKLKQQRGYTEIDANTVTADNEKKYH